MPLILYMPSEADEKRCYMLSFSGRSSQSLKKMVFLRKTIETADDKRRVEEAFKRYGGDVAKTEQAFNVVEVPSLFGRRMGEADDEEDQLLAEILVQIWTLRLHSLFPDHQFNLNILKPIETGGEVAVLFFQK
jgi:hypothetical protein